MQTSCFLSRTIVAFALMFPLTAAAEGTSAAEPRRPVWIIGGGPDVYRSQVQIERNVLWALDALRSLSPGTEPEVFFTDGMDPAPDIHEWLLPRQAPRPQRALAQVFDAYWTDGLSFRNHRIPQVAGTTQAESLAGDLTRRLDALEPDDQAWLLFIGHGSYHENLDNSIELWDRTRLRVSDLLGLFDRAPTETRLRFLFTQCYSGAFARLAAAGTNRCGFLAESADRESEGCSAAIEKRDYEDYSTYFFAALTGRPRDHGGLNGILDRDADGVVTPLEAHFHVLATAYSSDIPRSTSEAFLLDWRPWYLNLVLPLMGHVDNEYTVMAHEVASGLGMSDDRDPQAVAERHLLRVGSDIQRLAGEQEQVRMEVQSLQDGLRREILRRWPQAGSPYTRAFEDFIDLQFEEAETYILARPEYPRLEQLQQILWLQVDEMLDLLRQRTRLEMIGHLMRLGRLKAALESFGPDEDMARYRSLRECESAPF